MIFISRIFCIDLYVIYNVFVFLHLAVCNQNTSTNRLQNISQMIVFLSMLTQHSANISILMVSLINWQLVFFTLAVGIICGLCWGYWTDNSCVVLAMVVILYSILFGFFFTFTFKLTLLVSRILKSILPKVSGDRPHGSTQHEITAL